MPGPTLYIDHGTAATKALLRYPTGRTDPVYLPPQPTLDPPVGDVVDQPAQLNLSPRDATVSILQAVYASATAQAGLPIEHVVMVVPAGRGPAWRAALRRDSRTAGFIVTEILDAPAAVAAHLARTGQVAADRPIAMCDLGASATEVTVLAPGGAGFDVLAVVDSDLGGNAIDTAIVDKHGLTPAQAQAAKHALADSFTTHIAGTDLDQDGLADITTSIWQQTATTIREAIAAADHTPTSVSGVYLIGGGARLPLAAQALRRLLDMPVAVCEQPERAALLAAASTPAGTPPTTAGTPRRLARVRVTDLIGVAVPAIASAVLFYQFLIAAMPYPETGQVIAPWGDLALAALLTLVTTTMFARTIAVISTDADPDAVVFRAPLVTAATITALIIAVVYALVAEAYVGLPGPYLKTVLLLTLPLAAATAGLTHIPSLKSAFTAREPTAVGGQRTISIALGGTGVFALCVGYYGTVHIVGHDQIFWTLAQRAAGIFLGTAVAVLVSTRRAIVLYLAPLLALAGTLAVNLNTVDTLCYLYITALSIWSAAHAIAHLRPSDRK